MLLPNLIEMLCCPETRQELRAVEPDFVAALNVRIRAGTVRNRGGQTVSETIEAGLVRADGKVWYPVREGIPVMLVEEGVELG